MRTACLSSRAHLKRADHGSERNLEDPQSTWCDLNSCVASVCTVCYSVEPSRPCMVQRAPGALPEHTACSCALQRSTVYIIAACDRIQCSRELLWPCSLHYGPSEMLQLRTSIAPLATHAPTTCQSSCRAHSRVRRLMFRFVRQHALIFEGLLLLLRIHAADYRC